MGICGVRYNICDALKLPELKQGTNLTQQSFLYVSLTHGDRQGVVITKARLQITIYSLSSVRLCVCWVRDFFWLVDVSSAGSFTVRSSTLSNKPQHESIDRLIDELNKMIMNELKSLARVN